MTEKINICIIGAGNISNTRHIPAIMKNNNFKIIGIISDEEKKISRTTQKYKFIKNTFLLDRSKELTGQLKECNWFMEEIDAVIIGVPPLQHYELVKTCLNLSKHTLVEKPMMMNVEQCDEVIEISNQKNLVLNIMHTFQYASGITKMEERFLNGEFGELESIVEIQFTNRKRRLPKWYNELPLGLYYDEAAHFFYSAIRFGGNLKILNAYAQFNKGIEENTPKHLSVQAEAGSIPVQMYMNFNSPVCEWLIILLCEKKIAIYDYFKDILIVADNDNMHLSKDVLKTSIKYTLDFWIGFVKSGFKMVTKDLLYGHELVIDKFAYAILNKEVDDKISPQLGRDVVKAMNEVYHLVKEANPDRNLF